MTFHIRRSAAALLLAALASCANTRVSAPATPVVGRAANAGLEQSDSLLQQLRVPGKNGDASALHPPNTRQRSL